MHFPHPKSLTGNILCTSWCVCAFCSHVALTPYKRIISVFFKVCLDIRISCALNKRNFQYASVSYRVPDDNKEDPLDELLKDLEFDSPNPKKTLTARLPLATESSTIKTSTGTGKCFPVYLGGTNSERVRFQHSNFYTKNRPKRGLHRLPLYLMESSCHGMLNVV